MRLRVSGVALMVGSLQRLRCWIGAWFLVVNVGRLNSGKNQKDTDRGRHLPAFHVASFGHCSVAVCRDFYEHGWAMIPTFYLGTDNPAWLKRHTVPLFVSRRRIQRYKTLPVARGRWACDSGGFTEIHKYGEWRLSSEDYAGMVVRYADEIGNLDWAAPQDWMCEPSAVKATGLTPSDHQKRTVENFLDLRQRLGTIVIPVLQGWERDDYLRCVDLYEKAGVDLMKEATVGLGSVCRRSADSDIGAIVASLFPLKMHGFGMKGSAFAANADRLVSADSMAWSFSARYRPPLEGCEHRCCNHCFKWASKWRSQTLGGVEPRLFEAV